MIHFYHVSRPFLLLLCFSLGAVFFPLKSEYVVFKKVNGALQPLRVQDYGKENANVLYETINKYQWPSVLAFYDHASSAHKKELEKTVLANKPGAEVRYVCQKITEQDASLFPVWIPNVLYELCVMEYAFLHAKDQKLQEAITFLHDKTFDKGQWSTIEQATVLDMNDLAATKQERLKHLFMGVQNGWWQRARTAMSFGSSPSEENPWTEIFMKVNELASSYLCATALSTGDSIADRLALSPNMDLYAEIAVRIAEKVVLQAKQMNNYQFSTSTAGYLGGEYEMKNGRAVLKESGIIMRTIALELACQRNNQALIFRATAPVKHMQLKTAVVLDSTFYNGQPRSVSYGNGLLAGALFDPGATPYCYMARYDRVGYALPFSKLLVARNEGGQNLFYIPPISNLHGIFERGEFFHPRTKAVVTKGTFTSINGVYALKVRDTLGLITTDQYTSAQYEVAYLRLLSNNTVFLSQIKANTIANLEPELRENMRQVAEQLA